MSESLNSSQLKVVSKDLAYLYIGTPLRPRSTIIKIDSGEIDTPYRIPPMDELQIDQVHPKTIDLEGSNFGFPTKFILQLIGQQKFDFVIVSQKKKSEKTIQTNQLPYFLVNSDEPLPEFTFQNYIPMTPKLLEIYENGELGLQNEVNLFLRVVTRAHKLSRQMALSKLVFINSDESIAFCILLLNMRSELQCAVLRELARLGIEVPIFKYIANYLLKKNVEQPVAFFSFLYLFSMYHEEILHHKTNKYLMAEELKFYDIEPNKYWKHLQKSLRDNPKYAFLHLVYMIDNHPQKSFEFVSVIQSEVIGLKRLENEFKLAISHLIKFAEMNSNPEMITLVLILATVGRSSQIESDGSIKNFSGPLNLKLNYFINRGIKHIKVWYKYGLEDLANQSLIQFISHFPTELPSLHFDDVVILAMQPEMFDEWANGHPILKIFKSRLKSLCMNESSFVQIFQNLVKSETMILPLLLMNYFEEDELSLMFEHLDPEYLVQLYLLPNTFEIDQLLLAIIGLTTSEIEIFDEGKFSAPLRISSIKTLVIFSRFSRFMPINLFQSIIRDIVSLKLTDISGLTTYISKLNHKTHQDLSYEYLDTMLDLLAPVLMENKQEKVIQNLISEILLEWEKITFQKLDENHVFKLDSLKISSDDVLKTSLKINTWDPISVETIVDTYKFYKGEIPNFIEGSIATSLNRPNWEQLARHYLALGIYRPKKSALKSSQLREVPERMIDVLGQISLISETISYCQRNGFSPPFENVIMKNLYKRGWNIERAMSNLIPTLLGNVSPKLRAFLCAYLIIERGDVTSDMLWIAKDVANHQIRQGLLSTLERFGSAETWIILSHSQFEDLSLQAFEQLKSTRMAKEEKLESVLKMISSENIPLQQLGESWLRKTEWSDLELQQILTSSSTPLTIEFMKNARNNGLSEYYQELLFQISNTIIWDPESRVILQETAFDTLVKLADLSELKLKIIETLQGLAGSQVKSRFERSLKALSQIGE
ncbi:MAG: hypothetical protein IH840_05745 [Candidatus Heimdallarchaeota archaeon]|nr:hypothetical protein [Candidatus Heimdallarchaeota archaeon]